MEVSNDPPFPALFPLSVNVPVATAIACHNRDSWCLADLKQPLSKHFNIHVAKPIAWT